MSIDAAEDISKAICSDKFDPATGTISAGVFKGSNSSVSRLSICPLIETWELFRSRVEKPPARTLERIGIINVGKLGKIGCNFKDRPTPLTVVAMPLDGYLSHAEIPQNISRGLANEIIKNLEIHTQPTF